MRAGLIFLFLFSLAGGILIANTFSEHIGYSLPGPDLSQFQPPSSIFNYEPTNPAGIVGDFVWGAAQTIAWMGSLPGLTAQFIGLLGIPEPLASWLNALVWISLAGYIIYLIAGRLIFA